MCVQPVNARINALAQTEEDASVLEYFRRLVELRRHEPAVAAGFFSQLAEQAGHRIDAAKFAPNASLRDEFARARFHSQNTGHIPAHADRVADVAALKDAAARLDEMLDLSDSDIDGIVEEFSNLRKAVG